MATTTRKYKMEGLDCANCAAKMENAISKIDGVEKASISFMTQRLTITCDSDKLGEVLAAASMACKAIESEARILIP